jgi:hypothetical protein
MRVMINLYTHSVVWRTIRDDRVLSHFLTSLWGITLEILKRKIMVLKQEWNIVNIHLLFEFVLNLLRNCVLTRQYHGENKLIFNQMMMRSALSRANTFSWIFYSAILLKQQSVGRHGTPLGYIIMILSQPVFVFSP